MYIMPSFSKAYTSELQTLEDEDSLFPQKVGDRLLADP